MNNYTSYTVYQSVTCSMFFQFRVSVLLRLTESSAGVAEQLASTQRMAEDLVEAQSAALKSQETILRNGEELKSTLQHSTKGNRRQYWSALI